MAALNAGGHAGYRDWRLPTAEEAASLMEKTPIDGRHIDPVFGRGVNFIWTADRTPSGDAYVAYWFDGRLATERPTFTPGCGRCAEGKGRSLLDAVDRGAAAGRTHRQWLIGRD